MDGPAFLRAYGYVALRRGRRPDLPPMQGSPIPTAKGPGKSLPLKWKEWSGPTRPMTHQAEESRQ